MKKNLSLTEIAQEHEAAEPMERCRWTRLIFNGYEPDNVIRFEGTRVEKDGKPYCLTDTLSFISRWNDGVMIASIVPQGAETFQWEVDDRQGIADSWEEAWSNMPSFLTNPDEFIDHDGW